MRKLTFQSFALGSGEMPRIGDGDMGDSTYLGSAGRGRPFGWETRGAWDTGAPSFWAVSLPTLSVSAAFPSGRSLSLSTPHHGGSVATQAEGGFRSRSLWSGLSFLPPAKGTSLGLSPEPRIPLTWHLPAPAPGALGGDPLDLAPLHPIMLGGWRVCTQQAFLQTTESLAEMR